MVTVLDHYTTSFNWAPFNFAAIWLRPQWYLVTDSVITDVQRRGPHVRHRRRLQRSDVIHGYWALARKSVVHRRDADEQPVRLRTADPFNPTTPRRTHCAGSEAPTRGLARQLLPVRDEGVSFQVSNFGMNQRLFSVYDGPAYQDSNAYLNIKPRTIDDCTPFIDAANKVGRCERDARDWSSHGCAQSAWLAGPCRGFRKATGRTQRRLLHAERGHRMEAAQRLLLSAGLPLDEPVLRKDVDIRHFVIEPLFQPGTLHHGHRQRSGDASTALWTTGACSRASPTSIARPCSTTTTAR